MDIGTNSAVAAPAAAPINWRHTLELWAFGMAKVPLIPFIRPRVRVVSSDRYEISVALRRRTSNQVGSMYFGAIVMGPEMVPAAHSLVIARSMGRLASFVTRQVSGEFLSAAKSDVFFRSDSGPEIQAAIERAMATSAPSTARVKVVAFCPAQPQKPVARFEFELSVKLGKPVKAVPLAPYAGHSHTVQAQEN